MPPPLTRFLHRLRGLSAPPSAESDAALLALFAHHRDDEAFAALVARHGPMVRNVCRRVLGDFHAAEDCFQATFLILARRAASLRSPQALAGWLYGVASRVARDARRLNARRPRSGLEGVLEPPDPHPDPLASLTARDLLLTLEEEVRRMPQIYRLPLVLCCLEGLSQEDTAMRLGWTAGAVKGRLERGRRLLHKRLARRGLMLAIALGVAEAVRGRASAAVSFSLTLATARAATQFAAGKATAGAATSARAAALANGGLRTMLATKIKIAAALVLAVGMVGSGAGALTYRCFGGERAAAQDSPATPPPQNGQGADAPRVKELLEDDDRRLQALQALAKLAEQQAEAVKERQALAKLVEKQAEIDKERQALVERLLKEVQDANEQLKRQAARLEDQALVAAKQLEESEAARKRLEEEVSRLKKELEDANKKLKEGDKGKL